MSPKAKKAAAPAAKANSAKAPAKKEAPKKASAAKSAAPVPAPKNSAAAKAAAPKKGAKAAVATAKEDEPTQANVEGGEDMEEEEEGEGASSGGGNAAAIAAAGSQEMSASFKNFRHHPDMENFYRFIYENDLRIEALQIIDQILTDKHQKKAQKGAKASL